MKHKGHRVAVGQVWINRKDSEAKPRIVVSVGSRQRGMDDCAYMATMVREDGKAEWQYAKVRTYRRFGPCMGQDRWLLVKDVEVSDVLDNVG